MSGIERTARQECPPGARLIPLTQGLCAIVDEADYEELSAFRWCASRDGNTVYALRSVRLPDGRWTKEKMHRRILGGSGTVDHIDGNGINNRRDNLRHATHTEQQRNRRRFTTSTSGFVGVSWERRRAAWRAQIRVDGRDKHLGYFASPVPAAIARDLAAIELHGEFAALNFPGLRRPLPIVLALP